MHEKVLSGVNNNSKRYEVAMVQQKKKLKDQNDYTVLMQVGQVKTPEDMQNRLADTPINKDRIFLGGLYLKKISGWTNDKQKRYKSDIAELKQLIDNDRREYALFNTGDSSNNPPIQKTSDAITEMPIPTLSKYAEKLLLAAEKGDHELMEWILCIREAWDELPIINDRYGGGFIKWRSGDQGLVFSRLDSGISYYGKKITLHTTTIKNGITIEKSIVEQQYGPSLDYIFYSRPLKRDNRNSIGNYG